MVRGVRKRRDRGLYKRKGCHLAWKARRALRTEEATATRLTAGEVKNKLRCDGILPGETKGYDMSESCVALGELIKERLLIDYNIKSNIKIVNGCSVAELKAGYVLVDDFRGRRLRRVLPQSDYDHRADRVQGLRLLDP